MLDKNRLKYPLSIFIVWHPLFSRGKDFANSLYNTFCRDIKQPLSRGLAIPMYYRSSVSDDTKMPIPINATNATRNAIILLVDQQYFVDENYRRYTEILAKQIGDSTRIYPVALCNEAYELGCGTTSLQFIRAYKGDLSEKENFEFSDAQIKTSLLHDCARLLMNFQPAWLDKQHDIDNSPVKLFLSHAKKDGVETTKRFKRFIDGELKLNVFFDTVDIADGYEFEQQIEESIKKSALVVFHTDEYSAREWCRIEVLVAKRNKCPIVVVHNIRNGEKRAFPYMGNTPTITLYGEEMKNFNEIVNLTLYQVLNNLFQRELLESFCQQYEMKDLEFITITSPPELFNYIDIYKKMKEGNKKLIVLYPDPPLGAEELKVLNEIDEKIIFITPIYLPTL